MIDAVTDTTIEALADFTQFYVSSNCNDAGSAVREGATLLRISTVDNDKDGDGFRYLIGLKRGTRITPHLTCFFGGSGYGKA